jgi:SNF2 family DNA or RNA helicase
MKYKYEEGVIKELDTGRCIDSKEIFSLIDTELKNNDMNIRFSKIGVNIELIFELVDKKIELNIYAIKGSEKYLVNIYNNHYLDYIVINNVWHYLSGKYEEINNCLNQLRIDNPKQIKFPQYMELIKKFNDENINYKDNVNQDIKNITIENNNELLWLNAKLFEYQNIGYNWLSFMMRNNCGCILADEMGLGKTLQIITLMGSEYEKNKNVHFLIVAPMSLLENWRREIEKFYPSLSTVVHHGSHRTGLYFDLLRYNVVITAYTSVKRDLSMLNMIEWDAVILDEAQNIKTPSAERTRAVKMIKRRTGIAVTGTPFENHMTDIWSIVDFVFPNYLGELNNFNESFDDSYESATLLETLITPIMIRRLVKDVAKDLPDRVDIPQPIEMTHQEALLYEDERKQNVEESLKNITLDKIQKLRMFCTHPLVYNKELGNIDPAMISRKYERLCEVLEEIALSNEKAIIFTSFNRMIDIMVKDLSYRFSVPTLYLNGDIEAEERQKTIDKFSQINGSAIIICNPRVAGSGLNITAANHVIHYNLEWNPAVEDQASARAYRRGQEKTVFVHRFYYINTVEEIINERIQNKRILSETAVIGNNGTEQDKKDLIRALSLSPYKEEDV